MLMAGGTARTHNYRIAFYWLTEGDTRDFRMFTDIGKWVSQNGKVLDKKTAVECARLVADEFPDMASIDVSHANGPMARWVK